VLLLLFAVFSFLATILFCEKNEMGGVCGTYGGRERGAQGSGGET